uniref:ATP synthase subunit d, mitochondrial n=1 Tax=Aureoumbra lagunensis TaxID=44058 RepID=A0A7S3JVE1_9STRA|mmetsp:Transcript_3797/g.5304  ORF Transcript_3797/g.5304 Transcript_3797/m.5304 type:complete len:174 (+) Transcript_3797:73-594(+)|eukprot:CAMPEP_0197301326 /NCGR_PEP_ID=MMETSP0890-20130614/50336_1 /TAXON_ID=44058 ORGANISM="Aureoumbra lagunensis, Strain CCMP1510" /NCGR_SAMPLE_ID=MMETSP0890 /ASSEMBLY_ACC=CAM_ASM_000533 /LENGTH=173 /DNA_ID=CAMNT_0042780611 /DNA_START=46 /DNA_END=567 /DNA_ORIENTATION=-
MLRVVNRSVRGALSRGVRGLSTIDGLLSVVSGDEAKSEINRLKVMASEISSLEAKYLGEPEPIDFSMYKSKLGAGVVDKIEALYSQVHIPKFPDGGMTPEEENELDQTLKEADKLIDESKARIVELNAEIASLKASKVGPDTTVEDIYKAFPEIEKEVDEEIHNHEWGKDVNI